MHVWFGTNKTDLVNSPLLRRKSTMDTATNPSTLRIRLGFCKIKCLIKIKLVDKTLKSSKFDCTIMIIGNQ